MNPIVIDTFSPSPGLAFQCVEENGARRLVFCGHATANVFWMGGGTPDQLAVFIARNFPGEANSTFARLVASQTPSPKLYGLASEIDLAECAHCERCGGLLGDELRREEGRDWHPSCAPSVQGPMPKPDTTQDRTDA